MSFCFTSSICLALATSDGSAFVIIMAKSSKMFLGLGGENKIKIITGNFFFLTFMAKQVERWLGCGRAIEIDQGLLLGRYRDRERTKNKSRDEFLKK